MSQVVHQQSSLLAPLAVDAVLKVAEEGKQVSVDLNVRTYSLCIQFLSPVGYVIRYFVHPSFVSSSSQDIKVIKKLGGTVEDTELIDGLIFTQKSCNVNGPRRIEKAKIGVIQFCISPPKTDVSTIHYNKIRFAFSEVFARKSIN